MSMRIDNSNIAGVTGSNSFGSVRSVGSDSHGTGVEGEDCSTDTVKLSSASNLVALAKSVNSTDRQSRIAQLADQVRSGTYQVNPSNVSRAMLQQLT